MISDASSSEVISAIVVTVSDVVGMVDAIDTVTILTSAKSNVKVLSILGDSA